MEFLIMTTKPKSRFLFMIHTEIIFVVFSWNLVQNMRIKICPKSFCSKWSLVKYIPGGKVPSQLVDRSELANCVIYIINTPLIAWQLLMKNTAT
jgi:hypothetical protein